MPHHSSRRPSRMPKIFESTVYEEHTSSFTSYASPWKHSSRVEHIRRVDGHDGTSRDDYSRRSRPLLRDFSCCTPDDPHPLSDANRRGLSDHYFEKAASRMPPCCSPENPHPFRDIAAADLANHWVDNIAPATPSARKTDYENDRLRHESAHYANSTGGARSPAYKESRYEASPTADSFPNRKGPHHSDRYQDSGRYSQPRRGEQHPRRAPSAREPSHTSSRFDRPKATESRKEGARGSKPTHSSKYDEDRSRDRPEPKQRSESKRTSQGQHHDQSGYDSRPKDNRSRHQGHKEYDSRCKGDQDRRDNDNEYNSGYHSSRPRRDDDKQYDSRDQGGQSRRHQHDGHDAEYEGSQSRRPEDTWGTEEFYHKKFDEYNKRRAHAYTQPPSPPPRPTQSPQPSPPLVDHYKILGISPNASADEIKKAARSKRVSTHPDKLKKPGMSASELRKIDEGAALVGQAADVLQDSEQKRVYDLRRFR